jgi:hypothetical protein
MSDASRRAGEAATSPLATPPVTAPSAPASTGPTTPAPSIRTDRAIAPPRPAPRGAETIVDRAERLASAEITRETTLDDAAARLASDLRSVPGIERFANVPLGQLDRSGPRPLRTMWRIAREQLDERWGQLTIGEMIDRYGGGRAGGASR